MIEMIKGNKQFIVISAILVTLTFLIAYYISYLLFYGDNSYEVYSKLKIQKMKLQQDIKTLQIQNASLQKKYLELKNLEPEEL